MKKIFFLFLAISVFNLSAVAKSKEFLTYTVKDNVCLVESLNVTNLGLVLFAPGLGGATISCGTDHGVVKFESWIGTNLAIGLNVGFSHFQYTGHIRNVKTLADIFHQSFKVFPGKESENAFQNVALLIAFSEDTPRLHADKDEAGKYGGEESPVLELYGWNIFTGDRDGVATGVGIGIMLDKASYLKIYEPNEVSIVENENK